MWIKGETWLISWRDFTGFKYSRGEEGPDPKTIKLGEKWQGNLISDHLDESKQWNQERNDRRIQSQITQMSQNNRKWRGMW